MKSLQKRRLISLILFVFFVFQAIISPACSQPKRTLDDQLKWSDYYIAKQFSYYPRDNRYNGYLDYTAKKLNSAIYNTFGDDKNVTFYVCPSPIGFNAISFHRFIVFDSLLLDSLRYLAMGKVYYGGIDNEYTDRLARRVAQVSKSHQMGFETGEYYDLENPFSLPKPGQLNPEQKKAAEEFFIKMLASWMAHEGSHCMRDHSKHRIQAMKNIYSSGKGDDQKDFMISMDAYMNAKISRELEKDADLYAVKWLYNAGIGAEGFVTWLKFATKLEKLMGTKNAYIKTHPDSEARIKYIIESAEKYK